MNLHNNRNDFQDLISITADFFKIPEVYIEKDYWVTYILKNLSNSDFKESVVFKGGTSLSKIYKIIDRFSEDIDLQIINFKGGDNQRRTLFKSIEKTITEGITHLKDDPRNRKRGNIRKTIYAYELQNENSEFYQASKEIILELNTMSTPKPYQLMEINSYIAEFLETTNPEIITEYELEPFEINVLNKTRTFVEKIFAVLDFTFMEEPILSLSNGIRHIYDIKKLYDDADISKFFNSDEFYYLCDKVVVENDFFGNRKDRVYSETLLSDIRILDKVEKTYNNDFSKLVFGDLPDFAEIKKTLSTVIAKTLEWEQNHKKHIIP